MSDCLSCAKLCPKWLFILKAHFFPLHIRSISIGLPANISQGRLQFFKWYECTVNHSNTDIPIMVEIFAHRCFNHEAASFIWHLVWDFKRAKQGFAYQPLILTEPQSISTLRIAYNYVLQMSNGQFAFPQEKCLISCGMGNVSDTGDDYKAFMYIAGCNTQ